MNKIASCLIIAGVAAASALSVVWLLGGDDFADDEIRPDGSSGKGGASVAPARPGKGKNKPHSGAANAASGNGAARVPSTGAQQADAGASEFTPAEQKIVDAIQAALDGEDYAKLVAQLKDVAASTNGTLRARAVNALEWFAPKSLPELTLFMADADDDVRASAVDAYNMGLSQMESGTRKAAAVRMGLSAVTDKDQLESMVMQVEDLSDAQKIDVLLSTIDGKNKTAVEVAREHYEFVTGEKYSNREAAQKWLAAQSSDD